MQKLIFLVIVLIAFAVATIPSKAEACKCHFCDADMLYEPACASDCFPTYCKDKACAAKSFCNSVDFSNVDCEPSLSPTPTTWPILALADTGAGKPWSIGWKTGPGADANDNLQALSYSTPGTNPPNGGALWRRESNPPSSGGSWLGVGFKDYIPEDSVFTHPGEQGQRSVLRFTAPAAGCFSFNYKAWGSGDMNQDATSDIAITKGATVLYSSTMFGKETGSIPLDTDPQVRKGTVSITLAANDKIDFSTGYGQNNGNSWDDTRWQLSATNSCPKTYPQHPNVNNYGDDWSFGQVRNANPGVGTFEQLTNRRVFPDFQNAAGFVGDNYDYPKILRDPNANFLWIHPSHEEWRGVVRYTAPKTQCYVFKYKFWPNHFGGSASGDAAISIGTDVLYTAKIAGAKPGSPPTDRQQLCVSLPKDTKVDFSVGAGWNGFAFDLLALDVQVDTNCQQVCRSMFYYPPPSI